MRKILIILIAALLAFMLFCRCGEDEKSGDCQDNSSPVLYNVVILEGETVLYEGYKINPGAKLNFYLNYSDSDCNINGGQIWLKWKDSPVEVIAQIAADNGCIGEWPEVGLGFFKTVTESGTIDFSINISDSCGKKSNAVFGTIEVGDQGAPVITDVRWLDPYVILGQKTTLRVSVCDQENDLFGGEIFLYKHKAPASLDWTDLDLGSKPETKWSQHGVGPQTQSDSCNIPIQANIELIPAKMGEICLDVATTDGLENLSNRFGYNTEGVCITVDSP